MCRMKITGSTVTQYLRYSAGAGCFLLCATCLRGAIVGGIGDAGMGLLAAASLISGAICISPEATRILTTPFTNLIDYIYLGTSKVEAPPFSLRMARHYRSEWLLDEAVVEYRRLRDWHPGRVEVWKEAILTLRELGQPEEAARWCRASRRYIKDEAGRKLIGEAMSQTVAPPLDRAF